VEFFGGYFRAFFWNTKAFKSQFRNFIIMSGKWSILTTILIIALFKSFACGVDREFFYL
jgi:hypothetical protein